MVVDLNNIKPSCWVGEVVFARGAFAKLGEMVKERKKAYSGPAVFFVDHFFASAGNKLDFSLENGDLCYFVDSSIEPRTEDIDGFTRKVRSSVSGPPSVIIGIGGGCAMDTAKAVSNMLTNDGLAEDYQGWDLVKNPGIFKIGVPTISGTGAEASRTCVMSNKKKGLKLGMNSKFTLFDRLILDPDLSKTVERNQYFYTGMDAYIHCIESLAGSYRNFFADTFSRMTVELCREVFLGSDMMSDENREKLMMASFLGGCAIANSYVGLIHPFSAGLSVVFDTHHCIGNCIAFNALEDFYPDQHREFQKMMQIQGVTLPAGICRNSGTEELRKLMNASLIHEVPLRNALGQDYRKSLPEEKVFSIFKRM